MRTVEEGQGRIRAVRSRRRCNARRQSIRWRVIAKRLAQDPVGATSGRAALPGRHAQGRARRRVTFPCHPRSGRVLRSCEGVPKDGEIGHHVSAVALSSRSGRRSRSGWRHHLCAIRRQLSILRQNRTGRSCSLLATPRGVTTCLRSRRYVSASPRRLSSRGACEEHPTPLWIHPECSHVPAPPGPCPPRRHSVELTFQGD
jgi:hypothetical protein